MGNVKVLEKRVSDKIAAGEVVERPASVIKELLENAVDAKATVICVEIKNGGISYMRVTDNGIGMSREDVALSVLRHATSKIATEEDLTAISTLGFRGEALSSIAAVSRLEIYTKTEESVSGTYLIAHNSEIVDVSEAGCPNGTTVVVRELFSTVPARMKFLKKDFTEAGYIEDIVSRLALSHPEISVKFINNGKDVLFTPGDNLLSSAIFAVYGKEVKDAMLGATYEERGISVSGMCGKAVIARKNRAMETFFVNGRYIKSALLSRAAEEAYKNELMTGKFPALVLNITISPEEVDINIHPTKLEAKFADEKHIYHCVYWAVKNALYREEYVPKVSEHKAIKPQFVRPEPILVKQTEQVRVTQKTITAAPKPVAEAVKTAAPKPIPVYNGLRENGGEQALPKDFVPPVIDHRPPTPAPVPEKQKVPCENIEIHEKPVLEKVPQANKTEPPIEPPVYKICGQVFSTYIIVEKDGKMLMVDQHAAHERLRYEKLLAQYRTREISTQLLLCPEVVTLTATEFSVFCEHSASICDLGFDVEEYGQRQVVVRGTPTEAGSCDVENTLMEILNLLQQSRKHIDDELASKMLYRIACRGAVKANAVLNNAEMKQLLDDVFSLSGINTCPHGRPITIEFTKEFIEKQFKRIV